MRALLGGGMEDEAAAGLGSAVGGPHADEVLERVVGGAGDRVDRAVVEAEDGVLGALLDRLDDR